MTASKFCGAALLLPGEEWPVCPGCSQPMRLFVQLDLATLPAALDYPIREGMLQLESNGLAHHQFGDLGAGHLCQCPEHPQVVAFGWACS